MFYFISYLHVVHDELEEPSQGAAFLLYTRIHFSTGSEKSSSTSQQANFFWAPVQTSFKKCCSDSGVNERSFFKKIYNGLSVSYKQHPEEGESPPLKKKKSQKQQLENERRETHGNKIQVEGGAEGPERASVSRCYPPASEINVRKRSTSWLNHALYAVWEYVW